MRSVTRGPVGCLKQEKYLHGAALGGSRQIIHNYLHEDAGKSVAQTSFTSLISFFANTFQFEFFLGWNHSCGAVHAPSPLSSSSPSVLTVLFLLPRLLLCRSFTSFRLNSGWSAFTSRSVTSAVALFVSCRMFLTS